MKVSGSIRSSAVAAAYVAAHLPFLAPSLEDIDSINFALGLRDFDVAQHQPHPPGYPIYVALGRLSLSAVSAVAPDLAQVRAEALALAIWSAIAGGIALLAAYRMFLSLDEERARASGAPFWSVLVLAVAPLFWMSGLRPMSDLPGLAVALAAQALLVSAWRTPGHLVLGALLAGLALGVRAQTVWLTGPLLLIVAIRSRVTGARTVVSWAFAAAAVGVLLWAVPLLAASGGVEGYLRALGSQAGEDFAWVDMLWANPTPRRLAFALYETFVLPWGSVPMAVVVAVAAAAGVAIALVRAPHALSLTALAFGPYALFHLLFQETPHVRYALPLLPAIAWLVGQAVAAAGRAAPLAGGAIALFAAYTAVPGMLAYAREPHPASRAIADMSLAAAAERPAALFAHYAMRRPLQAQSPPGVTFVEPPRTNEWTDLLHYWRGGGTAPVWFLADPRRTDLALIDPQARRQVRHYRWAPADRFELNGTRPIGVDWYRLHEPGWFAGEGWSLTPELGGVTRLAGTGVDRGPIEALVRRRGDALIAMVGARHLGMASDGGVTFTLAIDGRVIDEWQLDPQQSLNVLRIVQLPAGTLSGPDSYARFVISARATTPDRPTPPSAIRQFDVQPATGLVHAFDEGWHEEEYDNATGLRWRWSSGRSVLRILPPQDVRLRLRGESPLQYFSTAPTVRVTAGTRVVHETRPTDDFEWTVTIPAADVRAADGRIAIETDPVYLPGRAEGTADERQLGIRFFDIAVDQVSP